MSSPPISLPRCSGNRQGEPMDDVIVDSAAVGERNRLSLQVKRSVRSARAMLA